MLQKLKAVCSTLWYLRLNPFSRRRLWTSVRLYFGYLVWSRLAPGPVVIPFVNGTRLLATHQSTGAATLWFGLPELEDMMLVAHAARAGDRFVDVGANHGVHATFAASLGAKVIAFEPDPRALEILRSTVRLNGHQDVVEIVNAAAGSKPGTVRFVSQAMSTLSHIAADAGESQGGVDVALTTVDAAVGDRPVQFLKVDAEGYERDVILGALKTLAQPSMLALFIELTGHSDRYGVDADDIHRQIVSLGYRPFGYDAWRRTLTPKAARNTEWWHNTIYLREGTLELLQERIRTGPALKVHGYPL